MASNPIPQQLELMFALAEDMADGLAVHGTAAGVQQNTETRVRADLAAARVGGAAFDTARQSKRDAVAAQNIADSNGKGFIGTAVGILKNFLGTSWSESWEPAGFRQGTISAPTVMAARQTLLADLRDYFTGHAAQEVVALNVTAAQAGTLFTALSTARAAVNNALADVGDKKVARDTTVLTLYRRMRGLADELGQLLDDNDPRWPAFGLVAPGASETPDSPDSLIAVIGTEPGTVHVDWADVPRALRYRVFKQIVGTDADFVAVATVNDSDATLSGLPSGATVRIRVTAVNDAGESSPSAAVEIALP